MKVKVCGLFPLLKTSKVGHAYTLKIEHFRDERLCAMLTLLHYIKITQCLFVLRFYGPVNPMGSCRARSVYLTTRLLGRLSPLSG